MEVRVIPYFGTVDRQDSRGRGGDALGKCEESQGYPLGGGTNLRRIAEVGKET